VLDALGYDPERDEVVDLFNGSGAVAGALLDAAGTLPIAWHA
jgi:methylase of polypeptide subunit release factors